jgi:dihydroorotate dehydrogenase (NAD+) catalytic subunit
VELRLSGGRVLIAYRLNRSFAWNAAHPPRLPPKPRQLPPATVNLFDRTLEGPVGIAAGPLPNAKWIAAYARLGYGLLTYSTVRSREHPASRAPNLAFCRLGDPTTIEPTPRRLDSAAVTWAYSLGLPSPTPDVWRADVKRARAALGPKQLLVVSVVGTPAPDGDGEQLATDYASCARWAAEAGADVVEVHLSAPDTAAERAQMVYEDVALSTHIVQRVRRAVGLKPVVAKVGAARSPRALHDLATATARWIDGFTVVNGLQRRLVKPDGAPALTGPGRELAGVSGAAVWEHCRVQVAELCAWRKAGAWDRVVLAVGGITTVERARASLESGANAALVATAALVDPLLAARFRGARVAAGGARR